MKCNLSLDISKPRLNKKSIEPDNKNSKSLSTKLKVNEGLEISIESDNISNLRAGVNTILRLVKVSQSAMRR